MIVYPAIDLRGGKVVRLLHGDPNQETRFSDDPLAVALRWVGEGAQWLHIVNLDGALDSPDASNLVALEVILKAVDIPIQYGGGVRNIEHIQRMLDLGVSRIITGTAVVSEPDFAAAVLDSFDAGQIAFALDANKDRVATHGWQTISAWTPLALGKELANLGAVHALYTDISRDGDMSGVNVEATAELARQTGLSVIASGGVSSLEDVAALRDCEVGIPGVIIGRALYEEAFTLADAIRLTNI